MPPGSSAAERALRELQLSGRDLGPFVIASHGWLGSQAPPQALLLLEYLPGGDLGLLLERQGPLGPQARLQPYAPRLQPYVPRLQPYVLLVYATLTHCTSLLTNLLTYQPTY